MHRQTIPYVCANSAAEISVFPQTLSSDGVHIHSVMVKMYRSQLHYVAVEVLRSQVLSQSVTLYFWSQTSTRLVAKIKETTPTSFSNINLFLVQQFDMLFSVGFCLFLWSIKISKIPLFLCLRSHCFSLCSKRSTWKVESTYMEMKSWECKREISISAKQEQSNLRWVGLTYSFIADVERQMGKWFPGVIFWIPYNGTLGTTPTISWRAGSSA